MNSKRNEPPSSEKSDTIRQNASSLISRGRVSAAINDDVRSSSTLNRLFSPKLTPRTVRRLSLHRIPPPTLRPVVTTILRRQYACNYLEGQQPRVERMLNKNGFPSLQRLIITHKSSAGHGRLGQPAGKAKSPPCPRRGLRLSLQLFLVSR